jgi:hypothetical protein
MAQGVPPMPFLAAEEKKKMRADARAQLTNMYDCEPLVRLKGGLIST